MSEELTPLQAYQQVMRFAALRGEGALRLAMHAAVPQVLRPELVHLLRLNFVPESLADTALEADVLFAPFCDDLGNGYFRFDANARQRLLVHLDPAYEDHATLRSRQVAGFLLTHFDEPGHRVTSSHDPVYEAYLEVERWVALAFLDEEAAAAQLAAVVRDASAPEAVVARFRVAGLTSALSTPLARHHSLLAYAAGVEMLQRGDVSAAREVLESLGDSEIEVAGIRLPAPSTVLREPARREREPAAQEMRESQAVAETPAPQRAAAGAAFEFYFCYSSSNDDKYLKQFFNDLSEEVRNLIGAGHSKAVGFFAKSSIALGDEWKSTVANALCTTKSVVAVLSPAFFKSDYCAREMGLFAERLRMAQPAPPLIKPIFWIPMSVSEMALAFQRMNLSLGDPNSTYGSKGLRHVLRMLPQSQSEYYELIREVARGIVDSTWQYQLPPLKDPPPDLAHVIPFWSESEIAQAPAVPEPPRTAPAPGSVYISYRRSDTFMYARRLHDALSASFPPNSVVMDVNISPDENFRSVISRTVRSADVVVAIIGPTWLRDADDYGKRRIDDADDLVRIEIGTAFNAGVPVLPVLVNGARMPSLESVPRDLAELAYRNAFDLRDDTWKDDVQRVAEIIRYLQTREREPGSTTNLSQSEPVPEVRGPVLIFAGHVIDPPARTTPRFPADKEDVARDAIRAMVQQELERVGRFVCAMASASKGADILFHEVCLELGIETRVYLPISVKQFATTFIGRSGGDWLERFNRLATDEQVRTTMRTTRSKSGGETDWQHNAETMFKDAKEIGGTDVTLIVLWDEQQTRSPGAVGDFVKLATQAGARVEIIDSRRLFGLHPPESQAR